MTGFSEEIRGVINNGLDIVELPAVGAFAANDSAASEVGTGDILADDDDATYITSADGDLGYTVGLPPLVGYVEGAGLELHIRMSITGGVNPDDPDNLDADAQVHIATDDTGDTTVGGFSDGVDEGMGFALQAVDGTIVDYVVPLKMDAWVDSTIADVVVALNAGAYLNVVGVSNNNFDTTPEVRVYQASVVMIDGTDPNQFLRGFEHSDPGWIIQYVHEDGDEEVTGIIESAHTASVDFKIMQRPVIEVFIDETSLNLMDRSGLDLLNPALIVLGLSGDTPSLSLYDESSDPDTPIDSIELELNVWYTASVYWTWGSIHTTVTKRSVAENLIDNTHSTSEAPLTYAQQWCGYIGNESVSYEMGIDNVLLQVHCNEAHPVG